MPGDFKKKLLIQIGFSSGIVIFILALNFFAWFDVSKRALNIEKLNKELEFQRQAIDSLVFLKEGSVKAAEYLSFLDKILPNENELINFRQEVFDLAQDNESKLTLNFGNQVKGTETSPGFIDFQASVTGTAGKFGDFLKAIESSNYFVSLDVIDFSESDNSYNASLRGRVFSR